MTTIRSAPFPAAAPQAQSLDTARQAAQRAFFAAALGQAAPVQAAPQPAAQAVPEPRPAAVSRLPDPAAEAPSRVLRPGSLLDIRV